MLSIDWSNRRRRSESHCREQKLHFGDSEGIMRGHSGCEESINVKKAINFVRSKNRGKGDCNFLQELSC